MTVGCSKVCTPIKEVGLGIRDKMVFNHALLWKLLSQYGTERDAWWRVAVGSKFGSLWGGWCSVEPRGASGSVDLAISKVDRVSHRN